MLCPNFVNNVYYEKNIKRIDNSSEHNMQITPIICDQWIRQDISFCCRFYFLHVSGSSSLIFLFLFLEALNIFFLPLKILLHFPRHAFLQPGDWGGRICPVCPHSVSTCLSACFTPVFFASLHCPAPSHSIKPSLVSFLIRCLIAESREWAHQHEELIWKPGQTFSCDIRDHLVEHSVHSHPRIWALCSYKQLSFINVRESYNYSLLW